MRVSRRVTLLAAIVGMLLVATAAPALAADTVEHCSTASCVDSTPLPGEVCIKSKKAVSAKVAYWASVCVWTHSWSTLGFPYIDAHAEAGLTGSTQDFTQIDVLHVRLWRSHHGAAWTQEQDATFSLTPGQKNETGDTQVACYDVWHAEIDYIIRWKDGTWSQQKVYNSDDVDHVAGC